MPKGDFLAVRDKVTLTLTGAIMGQSVNQTGIDNLWFARFVGPVKVTEEVVGQVLFDTSELTEVSINSDGDELASGSEITRCESTHSATATRDQCDLARKCHLILLVEVPPGRKE